MYTEFNKDITEMETWQVIEYLRMIRDYHVLTNFTRDMYKNQFNIEFADNEWKEFIAYCDIQDDQQMFVRALKYLNQWKGDNIVDDILNNK